MNENTTPQPEEGAKSTSIPAGVPPPQAVTPQKAAKAKKGDYPPPPPGKIPIWRRFRRGPHGELLDAWQHGKKAWLMYVDAEMPGDGDSARIA